LRFEFVRELQLILKEVVQPLSDLAQLGSRELLQLGFNLLNLAHKTSIVRLSSFSTQKLRSIASIISLGRLCIAADHALQEFGYAVGKDAEKVLAFFGCGEMG
jgi:hypothetical protein